MKKNHIIGGVAALALALTIACSSKTKIQDEAQVDSTAYPTTSETLTPVAVQPEPVTVVDDTTTVASLGASSSGRSR